jgi:hypothetical protein
VENKVRDITRRFAVLDVPVKTGSFADPELMVVRRRTNPNFGRKK